MINGGYTKCKMKGLVADDAHRKSNTEWEENKPMARKWILTTDVHLHCALITKDGTVNGGIVSLIRDFSTTESNLSNKVEKLRGNLWRTKIRFGLNDNPRATRAFLSVTARISRILYNEHVLSTNGMSTEKFILSRNHSSVFNELKLYILGRFLSASICRP